jgi:hypothetical protein
MALGAIGEGTASASLLGMHIEVTSHRWVVATAPVRRGRVP